MKKLFSNFYQSEYWAKFQEKRGWHVYKCDYLNNNIYIYYKKFIFIYILWAPGLSSELLKHINLFLDSIKKEKSIIFFYFRISVLDPENMSSLQLLSTMKWYRSIYHIGSVESFRLNIKNDFNMILAQCSGNWRHNYKRSLTKNLIYEIWENPDPLLMYAVIKSMEELKDLSLNYSFNEFNELIECFKDQMVIFRAINKNGETLAYRAAVIGSSKIAWDFLAAANRDARKIYASYGLVMELIKYCQKNGVEYYDFSGVDKKNNLGVYNFKKGVGGILIKYIAEYERGNFLLRIFINLLIFIKKR